MFFKLNKIFIFIICLGASFYFSSEESLGPKNEYELVVNEIIEILNQNHFKKNIEITGQRVVVNFLVNLDKEKIVFTSEEFNSYSSKFKNIYNLDEIFKIYDNYSDRSLELIKHQQDIVNLINTSNDLNTSEFI